MSTRCVRPAVPHPTSTTHSTSASWRCRHPLCTGSSLISQTSERGTQTTHHHLLISTCCDNFLWWKFSIWTLNKIKSHRLHFAYSDIFFYSNNYLSLILYIFMSLVTRGFQSMFLYFWKLLPQPTVLLHVIITLHSVVVHMWLCIISISIYLYYFIFIWYIFILFYLFIHF